ERSVPIHRLSPNARTGPPHIRDTDVRHIATRRTHVGPDREAPPQLRQPGPPMPQAHPPEPRPGHQTPQVGRGHIAEPIPIAAEGENGVGTDLELSGDATGEV